MSKKKIGLVNYGSGNYLSVYNALQFLDFDIFEIKQKSHFEDVDHIILPGVGSYGNCIKKLKNMDLVEALKKNILNEEKFFLGICVGMQVLSTVGEEFEINNGLDFIPGKIIKIQSSRLKIPHMGWSSIYIEKESKIFKNIPNESTFYFLHSYHYDCKYESNISSKVFYGENLVASIEKNNIYGVQFHPEKSQRNGLKLLKNFCELS